MTPRGTIFDCMVFIQVIASRGTAYRCYERVIASKEPLLLSSETLAELRSVLERPELRRKLPGITPERVAALLHHLAEMAFHVDPVRRHFQFPPDPKDEPYLNLAIEAPARSLLTRDKALLNLTESSDDCAVRFKRLHPELQILVPESFQEGL